MDEFDLIKRYFTALGQPGGAARADIVLGIGDDAALIEPAFGTRLAVAVDTLVAGRHFPTGLDARAVGYRCAAVNLSDMAAMAALPRYATLALTLPAADPTWLEGFAAGLGEALGAVDCALIGGDTTRGPLSITLQLIGEVPGHALTRAGARAGDIVLVSGTLGDAHAALELLALTPADSDADVLWLRRRFERPSPRLALARALAGIAHAAIDVSDGLLADVGHVATASAVAIDIELDRLPLSAALLRRLGRARALSAAACGGDDYELVVCVPPRHLEAAQAAAQANDVALSAIGRVRSGTGVCCTTEDGQVVQFETTGYRHFE